MSDSFQGRGSVALYQGPTLVGPQRLRENWALAPAALLNELLPSTSRCLPLSSAAALSISLSLKRSGKMSLQRPTKFLAKARLATARRMVDHRFVDYVES